MRSTAWLLFFNLILAPVSANGSSNTTSNTTSGTSWDQHFALGESLERQGQHVTAQREFDIALTAAEQLGPDDWKLPLTLHNLGTVARELNSYPEAERYYQRAVGIWETHHPQRVAELAGTLQNLGALNMLWERYSRAELNYRRAYELRLQALGPNHPDVGASLHGLAELAATRHRYAEAGDLYRQATSVLESAYGANSLRVADVWHNWGYMFSETHHDAEARALLDKAAAVYEKNLPEHPNMAVILRNLAELDMKAGDLTRAEERLERSLAICQRSLPPGHQQTAIILEAYGRLLQRTHRKKEAKAAIEKSRVILAQGARESGVAYTVDASALR